MGEGGAHGQVGVGAQKVLNHIIQARVDALIATPAGRGWRSQITVLAKPLPGLSGEPPGWTMDFKHGLIGVEVSFNNAGALPQNLLRFSVLAQAPGFDSSDRIRLGVLIVADESLTTWGSMDGTVPTFEQVIGILSYMEFGLPTPLLVLGLGAADAVRDAGPMGGEEWGCPQVEVGPGRPWGDPSPLFLGERRQKGLSRSQYHPFRELPAEDQAYWVGLVDELDELGS